jgi:hypothetical protein
MGSLDNDLMELLKIIEVVIDVKTDFNDDYLNDIYI